MLSINSDTALIAGLPLITVNTRSIRSEIRASDSGLNLKIYAVNLKHIYYMIRFCTVGSYHGVTGQLGVSAYCFDDSRRAYASIRVGLRMIRPIFTIREAGELNTNGATTVEEDVGLSDQPLKLKFILYKYVFENWEDPVKVAPKRISKEAFGRQLQALYEELINQSLIVETPETGAQHPKIVIFEERQIDRQVAAALRPTASTMDMHSVTLARFNDEEFSRTNFTLPGMRLMDLTNNALPFHPLVFRRDAAAGLDQDMNA